MKRLHPLVVCLAAAPAAAGFSFTDVTVAAGLDAVHAFDGDAGLAAEMSGGGAIGDFNNDGWMDIFFLSGGAGHDKLFINNGDGTFTDRAAEWGIHDLPRHIGVGAVAADINNDGFTDIYITSLGDPGSGGQTGRHRLLINSGPDAQGAARFDDFAMHCGVRTTATDQPDGFGAALGDYDLDGDLDLAVAGWLGADHNFLYRNEGNDDAGLPAFTDATASITLDDRGGNVGTNIKGFSPRFIDTDGDWSPEILWIADFLTSRYLRNNRDGTFTDITAASGTGLDENGMGVTRGDFDNDGLVDFFVTAIYLPIPVVGTEGNRLYLNRGDHLFTETAAASGVDNGKWGWGTTAVDIDHDGDLDIAETNGWSLSPPFTGIPAKLYLNGGDAVFTEAAAEHGFDHVSEGRGLARLDYDNDGDQDILIFSNRQRLTLLRNDLDGPATHWVRVFIDTRNRDNLAPHGVGARVTVSAGGHTQTRAIDIGPNYLVNDEPSAHFGLADAGVIDRLAVEFHDGTRLVFGDIEPDRTLRVEVPPCRADSAAPFGLLDLADILLFVEAYTSGARAADLAEPAGVIDTADLIEFINQFTAGCD